MIFVFMLVLVFSGAVCDVELNLEATDGENVNIPLDSVELEKASRVKITFKGKYEEEARVIEQFCAHDERCPVVKTPGVLLSIERRTLTLDRISSNNSGLYEALIFIKNDVFKIKATLVNKPAVSPSTAPLKTSPPKPPDSSGHWWLYALIPVFILTVIICGVVVCFCRRGREPSANVEEARETPAVSRTGIFKKMSWKKNCSDLAAVSFKACTEDTEDQLMDT